MAVLALTAWGAPVSTSFLVLTSFVPNNIGKLLQSSLSGYVLAFGLGWTVWWLGMWMLERWVFRRTRDHKEFNVIWYGLQWCSTGFLWSTIVSRTSQHLCVSAAQSWDTDGALHPDSLHRTVPAGGQRRTDSGVLRSKTNMADLRSATVIDFTFGLCLLIKASERLSSAPPGSSWD